MLPNAESGLPLFSPRALTENNRPSSAVCIRALARTSRRTCQRDSPDRPSLLFVFFSFFFFYFVPVGNFDSRRATHIRSAFTLSFSFRSLLPPPRRCRRRLEDSVSVSFKFTPNRTRLANRASLRRCTYARSRTSLIPFDSSS